MPLWERELRKGKARGGKQLGACPFTAAGQGDKRGGGVGKTMEEKGKKKDRADHQTAVERVG